jgi:small subunit ribosomal protein S9
VSLPLVQATGRRKRAVARVSVRPGTGVITINERPIAEYLASDLLQMIATEPLRVTETTEAFDISVTMSGGGISGQAGALRLGIARALTELDMERRPALKKAGFLTRDDRKKESKKYGLKKARKAPQYSKR